MNAKTAATKTIPALQADLETAVAAAIARGSIDFCTSKEVYHAYRALAKARSEAKKPKASKS